MDIEELTNEVSFLMEEFISDVQRETPPPLSLMDELIFKLETLHYERRTFNAS